MKRQNGVITVTPQISKWVETENKSVHLAWELELLNFSVVRQCWKTYRSVSKKGQCRRPNKLRGLLSSATNVTRRRVCSQIPNWEGHRESHSGLQLP